MTQTHAPDLAFEETVEVAGFTFPRFDLARLLRTVFPLERGERVAVFTDLPDARKVVDLAFLESCTETQRIAYETFYQGLVDLKDELELAQVDLYAYDETGGSNLDLPATVWTPRGEELPLKETLARYSIVLYTGTYSATAPITALAKELGIRGATMHGVNELVLKSGLAVDYREVSARAERLRRYLTQAERMTFTFLVDDGARYELVLELGGQEAQKSHGLVHDVGDIANLPAGEVYYVPTGAHGYLPQKLEDGTIAVFTVKDRGITGLHRFIRGDEAEVARYLERIAFDPNAGQLTELGLGTQSLPFAGCDIQDEKILGTAHVATGRSDHLGGDIDGASFRDKRNAMHNDILFAPNKTPEILVERVVMTKGGRDVTILEGYRPTAVLEVLL